MREPSTLDQLPPSAAAYYERIDKPDELFERRLIGKDSLKRRVYQAYFLGELYGEPRALLTYAEYVAAVKAAHARAPKTSIGVSWWTEPTWNEVIP